MSDAPWLDDPIIASADERQPTTAVAGPGGGNPWDADPVEGGGFDASRFDMIKESGSNAGRMAGPMQETAKDLDKAKRRQGRKPMGAAGAAAQGFVDWAGMGWSDEIVAGMQTGMDMLEGNLGDESLTSRYARRKKAFEGYSDDAWEDHPYAYSAGAVPGFAASAVMTPAIRGATAVSSGLKTGALWGGISGAGQGDSLEERGLNALIGAGVGGVGGAALGKVSDKVSELINRRAVRDIAEEGVASAAQAQADEFGIPLTRGQRTGNVYTQATENSMRETGFGDDAARVAQSFTDDQYRAIGQASDDINARLAGTDPATGDPRRTISQPNEAGEVLKRSIEDAAAREQQRVAAGNAADEQIAQRVDEMIEQRLGKGSRIVEEPYDVGKMAGEGHAAKQAASAAARDAAYDSAAQTPTVIQREGIEGIAERIREDITYNRSQPVIINADTKNANAALDVLSDVQQFRAPRNKADPMMDNVDPDTITGISPLGIEQVRKKLVALKQAAHGASKRSGDFTDYHATAAIVDEFDNQLQRIRDLKLYEGDDAWLDAYQKARRMHAEHRRTFRPDDQLKAVVRDIAERDATPEQVANYLYGRTRLGDNKLARDVAEHFGEVLGRDSDEFAAIKQGAWQRLIRTHKGDRTVTHDSALAIADDIDEFLSNKGRSLAETLFDEGERAMMAQYARGLRGMATSRRTPAPALEAMIGLANRNLQPTELARMVVGGENKVLASGTSGRLIETLEAVFGRDSEEFSLVRQAVWKQITAVPEGQTPKGAQRLSQNIFEMLDGKGRPAAEKLFSPDELEQMRGFANVLKRVAGSADAENPPKTSAHLMRLVSERGRAIMTGLGLLSGGIDAGASYWATAQGTKMAADAVGKARAKRLFAGAPDLSASRAIKSGASRATLQGSRAGRKAIGPASGGTGPALIGAAADEED